MTAFSLGPVALPVAPLLWLLALWLAQVVAGRVAQRMPAEGRPTTAAVGTAFWWAAAGGLLAARASFVASVWSAYAEAPASLLDFRDGGWHTPAGAVGAAAVLVLYAWRQPAWRQALAAGALAGALAWGTGIMASGVYRMPPLPALTVHALDGRSADLASLRNGKPAVVNLWASWCAPCRAEMPLLVNAQRQRPDLQFLYVNQGESATAITRWLDSLPYPLDGVWRDPDSALGPAMGSTGLPTTLFIDADGRVRALHFGLLSAPALAARLRLLGPPPSAPAR